MSKMSIEIEVPDRIRGTDLEKKLLEKAHKHALEQAVVELYKEGLISSGTGEERPDSCRNQATTRSVARSRFLH